MVLLQDFMAILKFQDISFSRLKGFLRVHFLKIYYFDISDKELDSLGKWTQGRKSIEFKDLGQEKAEKRFNRLLEKGFKELKNVISGKKTVYIHRFSGIPLIGSNSFGIVDRGSNIIEIKPITGCNLGCIYCSVDDSKRITEFVLEEEYITQEFRKLAEFKSCDGLEAHIGTQGEPFFYSKMPDLVRNLSKIRNVNKITIDTNGVLLTPKLIDTLVKAGMTRFNLSINALDHKLAKRIAGDENYDIARIMMLARHIAKRCDIIIAPVWIPGINDSEIEPIIQFALSLKTKNKVLIGIQNFLNYKNGRNPVKAQTWEQFYDKLSYFEKKYDVKLIGDIGYDVKPAKQLSKPFRKGDSVKAEIVCSGRLKNEMIAVSGERTISIPDCNKQKGIVKVRILRSKHNIFSGKII